MITSGVRDISDNPLAAYRWLADGRKVGVSDANGAGFEYLGSLIYTRDGSDLDLESASFGGGRINKTSGGYETSYFVTDHLGSVRATVNQNGALNSTNNYYPFGLRWEYPGAQASTNRWLYNGKELQVTGFAEASGIFDFGWRMSDSRIGRWKNLDKLSEKYFPISPYAYCANNPIKNVDPTGLAWFYYSLNGYDAPTWNWRDEYSYHTGIYDSDNNEIVLQGYSTVVVFDGSRNERLGSGNNINGEGAITANITVYGSRGRDDIQTFKGYTMTSDADAYGPIDEGMYNGNYVDPGKSAPLASNWVLEDRGNVRMMDGAINPNAPNQIDANMEGYKTGIFIHSTNRNGGAGGRVSTGCLLIGSDDWQKFNDAMTGVTDFRVQLIREVNPWLSPLKGAYIRERGPYYSPSTKIKKID